MQMLVFISLLLSMLGCAGIPTDVEVKSWLTNEPPEEFNNADEKNIVPLDNIYVVPDKNNLKASTLLAKTPWIMLSEKEAASIIDKSFKPLNGHKIYLVRGISQNPATGRFDCVFYRGDLWIFFGAMGSQSYPMRKQPIVIMLSDTPKRVYVTSSVMK